MTSAYALVNGLQLLHCTIPTESEGSCITYQDAIENLTVMQDHGRWELGCMLYSSIDWMPDTRYSTLVGEILVDGVQIIPLGALPGPDQPAHCVTRYIDKPPSTLAFRLRHDPSDAAKHPDEDLFLNEVKVLMEDESLFPPGGSAPHTNVHNRVKDLEIYQRVIVKHYCGKWTSWIAGQSSHLSLIKVRDGTSAELHLVKNEHLRSFEVANRLHHTKRRMQEHVVVKKMIEILEGQTTMMEYTELLRRMAEVPEFIACLVPSMTMLHRFLATHKAEFWANRDPEHTTRVGLIETRGH